MTSRRLLLLFVTLALIFYGSETANAQAAATITGRVVDAETNEPLPGVNVYLAHSTRGAASDTEGRYEIRGVAPGSYELVASMLGYASRTVQIEMLAHTKNIEIDFRLAPAVYDLDAVVVAAERPRRWKRNFNQFEELFLGTSANAKATEILNPEVLNFEVDGVTRALTATASAPLDIENKALGYRLSFLLQKFSWNPQTEHLILVGLPHFEALTPKDDEQARVWAENREGAFRGSLLHLFRSVRAGRSFKEGFQLKQHEMTYSRMVDGKDLMREAGTPDGNELSFSGILDVTYQGRSDRGGFLRRSFRAMEYRVGLQTYMAFVSPDGYVSPPGALYTLRYPRRVADMVPRAYGLEPADEPAPAVAEAPQVEVALAPLAYTFFVEDEWPAETPRLPKAQALQRALKIMQLHQWNEAAGLLDAVLKAEPENIEALYYRAICAREIAKTYPYHEEEYRPHDKYEDKWTKAEDRFEALLRRDSTYRDVVYQYALLWRAAQQYQPALALGHAQVRLRPDLAHARHGLFQFYRAYVFDQPKKALKELAGQQTEHARYFHAEALRHAGKLAEAEVQLRTLLAQDLTIPRQPIYLSLARLYYAQDESAKAQASVEQAIKTVETKLEADLVFDDVKYLVGEEELAQYQALDEPGAYRDYLQTFWQQRDPAPSLPHNERMAEHYRRLLKAEQDFIYMGVQTTFTDPDKTRLLRYPAAYALNELFNDKGLIYLRHGEPDEVIVTVTPHSKSTGDLDKAAELPDDLDFRSIKNAPDSTTYLPWERSFGQGWKPNESWRYNQSGLDFHFVVEGGGSNWRLSPVFPLYEATVVDREHWGGAYADLSVTMDRIRRGISPGGVAGRGVLSLADHIAEDSRKAAAQGLTTDRHTWPEEIKPLNVPLLAAAFRGDDGQTRLEIHYALPTGFITRKTKTSADTLAVELGLALHDAAWRPRFEQAQTITLPASDDATTALTGNLMVSLPPDSYHVAVHVRPLESTLLGAFQFEKRLPDFDARALAISDLLPAYRIAPRAETDTPTRADFRIVPNPYLRFATTEPVHLYFELYHLTFGADDLTRYTLEFTLSPLEEGQTLLGLLDRNRDEAALTIKMEQEGSQTSPVETIEIDVSDVAPGRYALTVRATDEHTGATVEASRPVELVK